MEIIQEINDDILICKINNEIWYLFEDGGTKDYNIFKRYMENLKMGV
jgi:hypothetical protein